MKEDIIKLISKVTKMDVDYLNEHSADERSWNSMQHIEILLLLEEEYDIRFDDKKIGLLNSVDAICKEVEQMV